jgi:hypothetical protein
MARGAIKSDARVRGKLRTDLVGTSEFGAGQIAGALAAASDEKDFNLAEFKKTKTDAREVTNADGERTTVGSKVGFLNGFELGGKGDRRRFKAMLAHDLMNNNVLAARGVLTSISTFQPDEPGDMPDFSISIKASRQDAEQVFAEAKRVVNSYRVLDKNGRSSRFHADIVVRDEDGRQMNESAAI